MRASMQLGARAPTMPCCCLPLPLRCRYVHEARLLGTPEGEELAQAFEAVKRQL